MLWLGYAGMPRRIQDYPNGYAGWHSVATSAHLVVILGLGAFLGLLSHATYFKRAIGGRHWGLPFVGNRPSWLILDKQMAARSQMGGQIIGVRVIREHLEDCYGVVAIQRRTWVQVVDNSGIR